MQADSQPKQLKKPKSLIPKPSNQNNIFKAINEEKERERSLGSKMGSRKNSISKIPKIVTNKDQVSKTEALYQRARAAMSKLQTPSVVNNAPKPPKPQSKH